MFIGQDMPHYAAVLRLYARPSLRGAVADEKNLYHINLSVRNAVKSSRNTVTGSVLYCSHLPLALNPFYDLIHKFFLCLNSGAGFIVLNIGEGVDHDMIVTGHLVQPYH